MPPKSFSQNTQAIDTRIGASRIDHVDRKADGTVRVRGFAFGTSRRVEFFGNRPESCQAEIPIASANIAASSAFDVTIPAPPSGFDAISIIATNSSREWNAWIDSGRYR